MILALGTRATCCRPLTYPERGHSHTPLTPRHLRRRGIGGKSVRCQSDYSRTTSFLGRLVHLVQYCCHGGKDSVTVAMVQHTGEGYPVHSSDRAPPKHPGSSASARLCVLGTGLVKCIDDEALGLCDRGVDLMNSTVTEAHIRDELAALRMGSGAMAQQHRLQIQDVQRKLHKRETQRRNIDSLQDLVQRDFCQARSSLLLRRACPPWPDESGTPTNRQHVDGSILHPVVRRGLPGAIGRCCCRRTREIWTSRTPWSLWCPSSSRLLELETSGR